ncbi:MAG: DMT family transporter [Thermodesulfobacteriota bacterium]
MNNKLYVVLLTTFALVAFAANSIICRMALGNDAIDPASFSTIRLVSGAVVLWVIVKATLRGNTGKHPGNWWSAAMLFLYAAAFSFAYVSLNAGVGALILFGAVQATMISAGLFKGERPSMPAWCGFIIALAGLVYLVLPGLAAPSFSGAVLMAIAGFAWGIYSLRGMGITNPAAVTADNFLRSIPMTAMVSLVLIPSLQLSLGGILLAALSGGLTSGIGYVVWYAALRHLSATRAAMLQLLVPIIAAAGGVLLLSEQVTLRLVLSGILIIGGVSLTLKAKQR